MKSKLEAELTIPQQTRFLVPIEMGRVERHVRNSFSPLYIEFNSSYDPGLLSSFGGRLARARTGC